MSIIFINLQLLFNIVIIVLKHRIDRKFYNNAMAITFVKKNPDLPKNNPDFRDCADFHYTPGCPS